MNITEIGEMTSLINEMDKEAAEEQERELAKQKRDSWASNYNNNFK